MKQKQIFHLVMITIDLMGVLKANKNMYTKSEFICKLNFRRATSLFCLSVAAPMNVVRIITLLL